MRKLLLLMGMCIAVFQLSAQTRTVTGRVTDESGNPLPSVSVQVKGTTTGTVTNNNGSFSLRVPAAAKTLTVSSLNFASQDVSIANKNNVDVSLRAGTADNLQEVVVVGYGTQKKQDVTS